MGILTSIKEKLSKRKAAKNEKRQSQTLQSDARQGLKDEHLASVPPPPTVEQQVQDAERKQEQAQGEGVIGQTGAEPAVQKQVGVEAPVPLAADNQASTTIESATNTEPKKTTSKKADKMATDEEYMDFLDKANQDPSAGTAKSESKGKAELKATDTDVPAPLSKVTKDAYYMSDADEPFVPVALKFSGKTLPDEAAFAKLVNHPDPKKASVEIMDIGEWDPQGQYKDVVEATREVSKGSDVRVYRIAKDGARAEYWVVGLEGGKLLGVKALAVES